MQSRLIAAYFGISLINRLNLRNEFIRDKS